MQIRERLKSYFKNQIECIQNNTYGYYCPNCSFIHSIPTAYMEFMWDEKYHKYKKYIKCLECSQATPAFEDTKDAIENWNDNFINKEVELFSEED